MRVLLVMMVACYGGSAGPTSPQDPVATNKRSAPVASTAPDGATRLRTKRWKFAPYFAEVKRKLATEWDPDDILQTLSPVDRDAVRPVVLLLEVTEHGNLMNFEVVQSSGVRELDEEAIRAAVDTAFDPPPLELRPLSFHFTFGIGATSTELTVPRPSDR